MSLFWWRLAFFGVFPPGIYWVCRMSNWAAVRFWNRGGSATPGQMIIGKGVAWAAFGFTYAVAIGVEIGGRSPWGFLTIPLWFATVAVVVRRKLRVTRAEAISSGRGSSRCDV